MSLLGGRGGRTDDWSTQHARARARAAERLAIPLEPDEQAWLDDHLDVCAECSSVADEYARQRLQLRALRDRQPPPPRDLWARTAAAIDGEGGGRRRRPRRRLAPYAAVLGALIVAVVYGRLSTSQLPVGPAASAPSATSNVAIGSATAPAAGPTPLAVPARDVAYLSSEGGAYQLNMTRIEEVCPADAGSCATSEPDEVVEIGPLSSPATVFGSESRPLVIVAENGVGSSVVVLTLADEPGPSQTPAVPLASEEPTPTPAVSSAPSDGPSASPTPPEQPTEAPTPSDQLKAVEIARGLTISDSTAAYAPDGSAFAFTARPADGSQGPDIYVWQVGEADARPITTDHRSVFGSWAGGTIAGSRVENGPGPSEPRAFVIDAAGGDPVLRPELGLVWRPVVDPTGGSAVYWAGSVEPAADGGWTPADGRLVIGRWTDEEPAASDRPEPTALTGDQEDEQAETTIATGPLTDWDVRWDETGERLAVWIADPDDPAVGRLSLYVVDPFDGRIDLENPPLVDEPALAGFSIADGRLAWASPNDSTDASSRVFVLAWTVDGFGKVESAQGDFILVR